MFDKHFLIAFIDIPAADIAGITKDSGSVGETKDVFKAVRNQNNGNAFIAELSGDTVQLLTLTLGEGGCRFIHDQNTRILGKGLCNFYHLLLGDGERANGSGCREVSADAVEKLLCLFIGFSPADERTGHEFVTDEDVFSSGQVRIGCSMLINGSYAMLQCHERIGHHYLFAVKNNFTAVRLVNTCQYFDKRRFPRAIFPYYCVDFAFFEVETDVIKCFYARKGLGNVIHFEQVFCHLHPSLRIFVYLFMKKLLCTDF